MKVTGMEERNFGATNRGAWGRRLNIFYLNIICFKNFFFFELFCFIVLFKSYLIWTYLKFIATPSKIVLMNIIR